MVAILTSYIALDLAGRVSASFRTARALWLADGALAVGTGIWSMRCTGMLAFKMDMPLAYEISLTLLSVVIATAASGLALFVVSRGHARQKTLLRIPAVRDANASKAYGWKQCGTVLRFTLA